MSNFIVPLYSSEASPSRTGAEASALARLTRAGVAVAPAFCVAAAAHRAFVEAAGLSGPLREALSGARSGDLESFEEAARRAAGLLEAAPMPEELAESIVTAYWEELGAGAARVRLSRPEPVGPESELAVEGGDALLAAVRRCWASAWSALAIRLCLERGEAPEGLAAAVLVQDRLKAEARGSMSTALPALSGRSGAFLPKKRAAELLHLGARAYAVLGEPIELDWILAAGGLIIVGARPEGSGEMSGISEGCGMEGHERVLVIGAGVNGSICAAGLLKAGEDVTLLARGSRLDFLREHGVTIENPFSGSRTVSRVPMIGELRPKDIYDYVLVVVRKNQVAELLPSLAANLSSNLVFMVNNPSGPAEYVEALGAERVMLGFVFGAGRRVGDVIYGFGAKGLATPFGEIDGRRSERVKSLVALLRRSGFSAKPESRMVDWQAAHAALVAPVAALLGKHGNDNYELAKSREDMRLLVAAMRDTLAVLRATGHRIVPGSSNVLGFAPGFVLLPLFRWLFGMKVAEVGAAWHCSQAPDEMLCLVRELGAMVERSNLPVPALRLVLTQANGESAEEAQKGAK